jgi:phosphatidate phosphatase APP1
MSSSDYSEWFRSSISSIDDFIDVRWRTLKQKMGWDGVPRIQPYIGFANDDLAWFHGRVLTNPPKDLPSVDDTWWDNLLQTYHRFESDEVAGVDVEIDFAGKRHRVTTDHEGYFHLETANTPDVRGRQPWQSIAIRIVGSPKISPDESAVFSKMLTPPKSAKFGIISDMDDTVLHTGITGLTTAARLTFFHNARTRKPLPGVGALYHALQSGTDQSTPQQNPIFYVSSSPWNLFDLLEDFLDLNDIPLGPILLRDLGFDRNKFLKEGHEHKLEKALRIMSAFPDLSFLLFGDSGQEDARLYAEAAKQKPDQVKAIFIRDVDPGVPNEHDEVVQHSIKISEQHGVPMYLIADSRAVAQIALSMEWIAAENMSDIEAATTADLNRKQPVI